MDYYKKQYIIIITIKDTKQPMLISRAKKKIHSRGGRCSQADHTALVPELCNKTGPSPAKSSTSKPNEKKVSSAVKKAAQRLQHGEQHKHDHDHVQNTRPGVGGLSQVSMSRPLRSSTKPITSDQTRSSLGRCGNSPKSDSDKLL